MKNENKKYKSKIENKILKNYENNNNNNNNNYTKLDKQKQRELRFNLYKQLIELPEETELFDSTTKYVLRELIIQPLATSWWISKNLKEKYKIDLTLQKLQEGYYKIQHNKLAQDLIEENSSGGKIIPFARGITLKPKNKPYYIDIQTTDTCPCRCNKCWNCVKTESGEKELIKRNTNQEIKPTKNDFMRTVKESIDLGIEQIVSVGGGEPFTNITLPEIMEYKKQYSKEKKVNVKTYIPTCGIGTIYENQILLEKILENIDQIRFSFDSLDKEFIINNHGITEEGYNIMMRNFKKVVEIKNKNNLNLDIEILILIYNNNHKHLEYSIQKAIELKADRLLINTINGDNINLDEKEKRKSIKEIKKIFKKYSKGDYGNIKIDFDPLILNNLENFPKKDIENIEPLIGNLRYCIKNIFALTPIITQDGTLHNCFPCSQPIIANKKDIYKVGNITQEPLENLLEKLKGRYKDINPKSDCMPDCRDIYYFNTVLRKILDDMLLGISPTLQPYLDKTKKNDKYSHIMHDEKIDQTKIKQVVHEYKKASEKIRNDQNNEFEMYIKDKIKNTEYFKEMVENNTYQLLSRYELNLFSVGCIKNNSEILFFSPELKKIKSYRIYKNKLLPNKKSNFDALINEIKSNDKIHFNYNKIKEEV